MEAIKPIKRSKQLAPLSREHHEGLLLCWKINTGLAKGITGSRIKEYLVHFYDHSLKEHFEEEEQYLFPLLPHSDKNIQEAITHHELLRSIINSIRDGAEVQALPLQYFADVLEKHIRFEERVLFNIIEDVADEESLQEVTKKLSNNTCQLSWQDQFWLKETN